MYNPHHEFLFGTLAFALGAAYDEERPIWSTMQTASWPGTTCTAKGIDESTEWGHREMDGHAREGNGRDERERTSQILMRYDPTLTPSPSPAPDIRTFYYQQNHEGSVTHLTNGNGTIIEKYRYDAFGAPTFYNGSGTQIPSTAYNNRFLFTGREYTATFQGNYFPFFKFYEYRARAYNPQLGRFMSEDPKLFDAGDYNLFRYCHNDPIDFTDPMGLEQYHDTHYTSAKAAGGQYENARDVMAAWADSSNTSQGSFGQFAKNHGLSMGQSDRDPQVKSARVIKTGDQHKHVPDVYVNGTKVGAKTDATLTVPDPKQEGRGAISLTAKLQLDVYYSDNAGPKTKWWSAMREPDHEADFDDWLSGPAARIAGSFTGRSFDSAAAARNAFDKALRPSFERAWGDSHAMRDRPVQFGGHQSPFSYEE